MVIGLPPSANANPALAKLNETIRKLQTAYPEAFFIIAGGDGDPSLPDELHTFFARFDAQNKKPAR